MKASVEQILHDHHTDDMLHTHVSMLQPKGKFVFNRQDLENFWDTYCNKIYENNDAIIGVAEKPQQYMPVLADIDLKVKDSEDIKYGEHLYTDEQAEKIIGVYQSVLRNIVDNCMDENLVCVLLEKAVYFIGNDDNFYIKNGFHLHFPNLFLNKIDQEVHLIPRVQDIVQNMNIFSNLGIENSATVIDKSSCRVPWLLYGSRKSEDMEPYKLTKIYNSDCEIINLDKAFRYYIIYDHQEKKINIRNNISYYLPRILSIIPFNRTTHEIKTGIICPMKEKLQQTKQNKNILKVSVEEALETSSKLLPMLSDWRASERNEWITIGWLLYNIGDGSTEALEQWIEFSSRCGEKHDESVCVYEWDRMIKKDLTIGTLRYFASIDSPEKYKEFINEQSQHYMKESINGSHNDIAKVLYAEYSNEFVCASISNKVWYQFRNHRWEEIEDGIFLREKISGEIANKYTDMGKQLFDKLNNSGHDKALQTTCDIRLKIVQRLVINLKSCPYKNNIMKEAAEVFYDRKFKQKLDKNPYIFAFNNGIYDLKLNIFRPGRPEDYVSKAAPIDYKEYNISDEEVQNIIEFLQKVFPDQSVRTYFLDTYSDIFVGGNNQKKVYMWTGEGDNGKSITQLLLDSMLGELAVKFNTQYFTGKKVGNGAANPELARAVPPVRSATMEEPDADEQLNIGELKKLSGGDSFVARDLFEKGKNTKEVCPMFMLTFICNRLPKLKYSDKATWNRIRVLPFESTFVEPGDPCPDTLEQQMLQKRFPMDKEFKHKIPGMVTAFAWYLLEWRKKVTTRVEPEKVTQATAIYRRQNDIFRQFIEECLIEDDTYISMNEIYAQFKEWFKEGWPNTTLLIKNDVKEYFEKVWGEPLHGQKWRGYRIRTLRDELDSGDAVILEKDDLVNYQDDGLALPP